MRKYIHNYLLKNSKLCSEIIEPNFITNDTEIHYYEDIFIKLYKYKPCSFITGIDVTLYKTRRELK